MENINIKIENTTNNTIIKFVSDSIIVNRGSYEFNNIDEAKNSAFVQQLFYLPFVKKVFVAANFIAIQRYDIVEWEDVQEEVRTQIEAYLNTGKKVIEENNEESKKEAIEVYAEVTPNPAVMKFGSNKALTQTDIELKNIEEANSYSPLAKSIIRFSFCERGFYF